MLHSDGFSCASPRSVAYVVLISPARLLVLIEKPGRLVFARGGRLVDYVDVVLSQAFFPWFVSFLVVHSNGGDVRLLIACARCRHR